jgi:hypothetical protein
LQRKRCTSTWPRFDRQKQGKSIWRGKTLAFGTRLAKLVTSLQTLVPWAKSVNLVTVAVGLILQPGKMMNSDSAKPESSIPPAIEVSANGRQEVRCAVRFPVALQAVLSSGTDEVEALTRNVSASGVLFALDRDLQVGLDIRFSMRMPHTVLGSPNDVMVHCKGRVVRCSSSHNEHLAAATIDEYQFAEH